jgi:uncharacterized protein (DUF1778 family)
MEMIMAAEEQADEALAARTVVPAASFDELVAALDEPPEPNEALRASSRREIR